MPRAKTYYELSEENLSFTFPEPGLLDGVKSKGKAIIKMDKCTYTYPTKKDPTVIDITLQASLNSRVAVIGPNGAGKSTLIKMFCGESKPQTGTVWRHQNMRIAYVAQHAFHHLEKHLQKTAVQYILWRFAGNDDRESLENQTKETNVDEEALRAHVSEHLVRYKVPRSFEFVDEPLKDDAGKVRRRALREARVAGDEA